MDKTISSASAAVEGRPALSKYAPRVTSQTIAYETVAGATISAVIAGEDIVSSQTIHELSLPNAVENDSSSLPDPTSNTSSASNSEESCKNRLPALVEMMQRAATDALGAEIVRREGANADLKDDEDDHASQPSDTDCEP